MAFISCSLTKAEQNYAQIEKECLAIVFACERFNQCIHGRDQAVFKLITDHWYPFFPNQYTVHQNNYTEDALEIAEIHP